VLGPRELALKAMKEIRSQLKLQVEVPEKTTIWSRLLFSRRSFSILPEL